MSRGVLGWVLCALALVLAGPACATDTVYYYYTDALHSAVVVTDAQGNVIERTSYAPYGQVLNRALRDGPGYGGHAEDPETQLVYMQQRYYDAQSGRFLSVDPVAATDDGGNFNRYAYASNNPYTYTDPEGEAPTQPIPAPGPCNAGSGCARGGDQAVPQAANEQEVRKIEGEPKTLATVAVTAMAISRAAPAAPALQISLGQIGSLLGTTARWSPYMLFFVPTSMGAAPCEMSVDTPCGIDVVYSKGGKQNIRDTGLIDVTSEEIKRRLKDPGTSAKEKRRLQKEQKSRGIRNKTRREEKFGGGG